ncbi:hypothetical protein, partial [Aliarcobacter skirrowii]|uniref:hypothetical protein n=1 Tax=Aliarcobacter skirrowii TaxID=28200 RepID=UPI0029AA05CE
ITPKEAIKNGERNFIILSIGNKNEMKNEILSLCPDANVIVFEPITKEITLNIANQIQEKRIESVSIWGIDNISDYFSSHETIKNLKINNYVDSKATIAQKFNNLDVITPKEAIKNGERNFIILSIGNKNEMKNEILSLCPDANVIVFENEFS